MIVDSHTHVASADTARWPRHTDAVTSDSSHAVDGDGLLAAMDAAGVERAVVVQFVGAYGWDNSYGLSAVAASDRLAFVGAVDMAGDPVTALRDLGPIAGLRPFGVGVDAPTWLTDGRGLALWEASAELGITLVPCLWARDLPELRPLIEAHPTVPVAIDHCGFPDPPDVVPPEVVALADLPPVHVKVSTHVLAPLAEPDVFVATLAEHFGDRLCWGSDFPQTHSMAYVDMVGLGLRAAAHLDETGRTAFLGGTAQRLWF